MRAVMTVLSLSMTTLLCAGDRQDKDPTAVSWVVLEMTKNDGKIQLFAGDLAAYWALD